jgi:2-oxoglutarate dehydrogenase E2 component (dihydrolipoamide succinyltransferase)
VKKLVADNDLDPTRIPGTGRDGLITKGDVLTQLQAPAPAAATPVSAPAPAGGGSTRKRMSSLRQRIATRLVQAQHTAAILTTFNEVDMSAVMDLRKKHKEEFEKKLGVSLGFMSFFAVASVKALQ